MVLVTLLVTLSPQSLELTCSMAAFACFRLLLLGMWRWRLIRVRQCSVCSSRDQCPLQYSGTTHKGNWCLGPAGTMCTNSLLVVVRLHISSSRVTTIVMEESTSAEWLFLERMWRSGLCTLVSLAPLWLLSRCLRAFDLLQDTYIVEIV